MTYWMLALVMVQDARVLGRYRRDRRERSRKVLRSAAFPRAPLWGAPGRLMGRLKQGGLTLTTPDPCAVNHGPTPLGGEGGTMGTSTIYRSKTFRVSIVWVPSV